MEEIKILWTSGWDSTFRILQLVENLEVSVNKEYKIQPIYVIDRNRASFEIEIERMNEIKEMIKERFPNGAKYLNSIKFYEIENISLDEKISASYNRLREEAFMGSQYEWLGRLAKEIGNLELCIHRDDKAHYFLKEYCRNDYQNCFEVFYLDKRKAAADTANVFGKFIFPLFNYTKVEMQKEAEAKKFIDIMNRTWFCHSPIKGKPCGICNPCSYTIEEKMEYRLDKMALMRNKYKVLFKIVRKIKNKIK